MLLDVTEDQEIAVLANVVLLGIKVKVVFNKNALSICLFGFELVGTDFILTT